MKIITLEEHYSNLEIIEENSKYGSPSYLNELDDDTLEFYNKMRNSNDALTDINDKRFKFMEEQKVDMQILSYTNPISDSVPKEEAIKMVKKANDYLYEIVNKYPQKFKAFATLPMSDPIEAAKELERCVKEYGFVGALISGTHNNKFYDDEEFLPIFAKAAELDVVISWHPEYIPAKIQQHYYFSNSYPKNIGMQFASAGFGWHLDVGIHITRLVLSGIFDKFPNLKFISGHWGEGIPFMIDRMDQIMKPSATGLKKKISDYFKENIYYTPSGILSSNQLEYMVKIFGANHILWALDYPYINFDKCSTYFLLDSNLTDEEKELIAYKNAERILHI